MRRSHEDTMIRTVVIQKIRDNKITWISIKKVLKILNRILQNLMKRRNWPNFLASKILRGQNTWSIFL